MKYRKKPVVIDAFKYDESLINTLENSYIPEWAIEAFNKGTIYYSNPVSPLLPSHELYIKTLEGELHVSVGDYIIKGVNGEFYPCKPDIFEKTYEPV